MTSQSPSPPAAPSSESNHSLWLHFRIRWRRVNGLLWAIMEAADCEGDWCWCLVVTSPPLSLCLDSPGKYFLPYSIRRQPDFIYDRLCIDTRLLSLFIFRSVFVSKKTPNNAVIPQRWVVLIVLADCCQQSARTISTTHLCGITALFGVFLETKKHQNLLRLRRLVSIAYMQSLSPHFITSPGPCFIMSPGPGPVRVLWFKLGFYDLMNSLYCNLL